MRMIVGILVALAAACGPSASCEDETADLAIMLRKMPKASRLSMSIAEPGKLQVLDKAVVAPGDIAGDRAIVLTVDANAIVVQGQLIPAGNPDEVRASLGEALERERFMRSVEGGGPEPSLLVAAAPDATWKQIGTLLEGIRLAGQARAQFVFRRDTVIAPLPASKITPELDKLASGADPSQKATRLAQMSSKLFERCDSAKKLFGSLAMMPPDQKESTLRADLAQSIRDCSCKCDVKSVQAVMHFLLAPPFEAAVVTVPLGESTTETDLHIVKLPAATPWSEAHRAIVEARNKPSAFLVE